MTGYWPLDDWGASYLEGSERKELAGVFDDQRVVYRGCLWGEV